MEKKQRVIKFRAWDGKSIFEVDVLAIAACSWGCYDHGRRGVSLAYQSHISVMQFTGLHDKNGKEIYESDILKQFNEAIGPYWVVFENGSFVCYTKFGRWGLLSRFFDPDFSDYRIEVMANIYENPELITPN